MNDIYFTHRIAMSNVSETAFRETAVQRCSQNFVQISRKTHLVFPWEFAKIYGTGTLKEHFWTAVSETLRTTDFKEISQYSLLNTYSTQYLLFIEF